MNKPTFSKIDTNICKGVAILFMILHHAVAKYYNHFDLSWYAANSTSIPYEIMLFFSTAGKVCVSLLTILSGYGLAKSYSSFGENSIKGDIRFIVLRYIKLYSVFFPVVLIITIVGVLQSAISGEQIDLIQVLKDTLKNLTIFKSSVGGWYLKAIFVLYLMFPILYRLIKKYGVIIIFLSAIPWILRYGFGIKPFRLDSFWYYILSFAVGIYAEQKDIFTRSRIREPATSIILPITCLIATFIMRLVFSLPMDLFFACSIVFLEMNVLSKLKSSAALNCLGTNSANMWLLHSTFLHLMNGIHPLLKFVFALLISLLASVLIEYLKGITKYNKLVSKVCGYLRGNPRDKQNGISTEECIKKD